MDTFSFFSNAESYTQLLSELKLKYPMVKDVYYSNHTGQWSLQFKEEMEHADIDVNSFDELLEELQAQSQGAQ